MRASDIQLIAELACTEITVDLIRCVEFPASELVSFS